MVGPVGGGARVGRPEAACTSTGDDDDDDLVRLATGSEPLISVSAVYACSLGSANRTLSAGLRMMYMRRLGVHVRVTRT